jgi:hypothetical protein
MSNFAAFRTATKAAKERTGNQSISTDVKQGKVRVSSVTFDMKGKAKIDPITGYLSFDDALNYLENMGQAQRD